MTQQRWTLRGTILMMLLFSLIAMLLVAGCDRSVPQPTGGTEPPALSEKAVVHQWVKSIKDNNRALFDDFIVRRPAGEDLLAARAKAYSALFADVQDDGVALAVTDVSVFEEPDVKVAAAAILRTPETGAAGTFPVYLIMEEGRWRVLAGIDDYTAGYHRLSDAETTAFERAEDWYNELTAVNEGN